MAYDGAIKFDTSLDTNGLAQDLGKLGTVIAGGLGAATAAVGALSVATVKLGMDFGAQMAEVGAISEASAGDMVLLTEKAKEMGAATKFSATESAQAFSYMAQAGWQTEQMLSGIEGVMLLAAASGEDLALTANVVTDSMTAFGLSADKSAQFADVLAMAANASNTGVAELGESFKYVAPVAGALGYSVEDVSVALGLMANQGIKASSAGTALRTLMTNLTKPTKQMQAAMDELGISLTDSSGAMKPFGVLMEELREKFSALTPAQKAQYAATIAGKEGMSGLLAIVNASSQDFETLTDRINDSAGAAQAAADIMNNTLQGDMDELSSAIEGLGLELYESFEMPLRQAAQFAAEAINGLAASFADGKLKNSIDIIGQAFGDLAQAAANFVSEALPVLINGFALIIENSDLIVAALSGIGAGFAALKGFEVVSAIQKAFDGAAEALRVYEQTMLVTKVTGKDVTRVMSLQEVAIAALSGKFKTASDAASAFQAVLAANPVMVYAAAIGAVVAAIGLAAVAYQRMHPEIQETRDRIEELGKKSAETASELQQSAEAFGETIGQLDAQSGIIAGLVAELESLDGAGVESAESQERIASIVAQLNTLVPELGLAYDAQTGALNKTNEELKAYIANQEAAAYAAAYQERATEIAKEQIRLETERKDLLERLENASRNYNEEEYRSGQYMSGNTGTLRNYNHAQVAFKEEVDAASAALSENTAQSNILRGELESMLTKQAECEAQTRATALAIEEQSQSWEDIVSSVVEAGDSMGQVWHDYADSFAVVIDDAEEFEKEYNSVLSDISNDTNKTADEIKEANKKAFSADDILEDLEARLKYIQDYNENLKMLVTMGATEATMAYITSQPDPQAAAAGWVEAGDAKIQALNDTTADITIASAEATRTYMGVTAAGAAESAAQFRTTLEQIWVALDDTTRDAMEELAKSMGIPFENGMPQFIGTAEQMAVTWSDLVYGLPKPLQEVADTISNEVVLLGQNMTNGISESLQGVDEAFVGAFAGVPGAISEPILQGYNEAKAAQLENNRGMELNAQQLAQSILEAVRPIRDDLPQPFIDGLVAIANGMDGAPTIEKMAEMCDEMLGVSVDTLISGQPDVENAAEGVLESATVPLDPLAEMWDHRFKEAAAAGTDAIKGSESDIVNTVEDVRDASTVPLDPLAEMWGHRFEEASIAGADAIKDSEGFIKDATNDVGVGAGESLGEGLDSTQPQINASGENAAREGVKGAASVTGEYGSEGENAGQGYVDGIRAKIGAAKQAATDLAQTALKALQIAQDSHSPSKLFAGLGGDASSGYAAGIEDNASLSAEAAEKMTKGAIDAIAKAQDSHSDSKVTMGLGGDNASGFASGITNKSGLAAKASKSMTEGAVESAKKGAQGFNAIGEESGELYATGLHETEEKSLKAGVTLADKAIGGFDSREPDFKKSGLKSGEAYAKGMSDADGLIEEEYGTWLDSMLDNTTTNMDAVSKVIDTYHAEGWDAAKDHLDEYTKREAEAAKERLQTTKDELKEREKAEKEAVNKSKKLTKDQKDAQIKIIEQRYKEEIALVDKKIKEVGKAEELGLEQQIAIWDEITRQAGKNLDLRYRAELESFKASKALIDESLKEHGLAAEQESEIYFELAQKFQGNERIKSEALQEGVRAAKDAIDERMSYEYVSYEERMAIYDELRDRVADDAKARADAEKGYLDAAKGYVAERVEAEEWGAGEVAGFWAKEADAALEGTNLKVEADREFLKAKRELAKEIEAIEQEYADALEKRTEQLANSFGLFEEVSAKVIEKQDLFKALESQNATLSQWTTDLGVLTQRGLDEGMIAELQQMGPKSADQVRAMTTMTDEELARYVQLWQDKQRMAREQAVKELEPLRAECDERIQNVLNSVIGLIEGAIDPMEDGGRNLSEGIARGILDGSISVDNAIQQVIESALATANQVADAHSPARRFMPLGENIDEGIAVGVAKKGYTEKATANVIDQVASQSLSNQQLSALTQSALSFMGSRQAQLAATHSSYSTVNNTSQTQGGDIVFQPGSIVVNEAQINSDMDINRVGRQLGEKFAREAWLRGVFINDMG